MRSVVFLPPPTLPHFEPAPTLSSSRSCTSFKFALARPRRPLRILADETRPVDGDTTKEIVPDSVDPFDDASIEQQDSLELSQVLPPRILADETRYPLDDATEIVPDSVDPQEPLLNQAAESQDSIARSQVLDAPIGVPWELLHEPSPSTVNEAVETSRMHKRVRIRESPVVVFETPERSVIPTAPAVQGLRPENRIRNSEDADTSVEEGAEADKSRVVLGVDSESEADADDAAASTSRGHRLSRIVADDMAASMAPVMGKGEDAANTTAQKDPGQSEYFDLSVLAGVRSRHQDRRPSPPADATYNTNTASVSEQPNAATQSASSLQIRPPIPAAAPPATCRFTFFRPRGSTSIGSVSAALHIPMSLQNDTPHDHEQSHSHAAVLPPDLVAPHEAIPSTPEAETSTGRLPAMNAVTASYDSLPLRDDSLQEQSILPPPTLHFALSAVTPLSRILADPTDFLASSSGRVRARSGEVGGVSSRVNLLVVVKEVGEVMRVRTKYGVDPPVKFAGRPELGSKGISRAFTEAYSRERHFPAGGDGKTERVELIVMDGEMSCIPRLVDSESSEFRVVQEAAEKFMFSVVLWGKLARDWATDNTDASVASSLSQPTTLTPTQLRAGDVVSLTNISLSRVAIPHSPVKRPLRRLGPGLPPPPPQPQPQPQRSSHKVAVGHATATNNAALELCYRSQVYTPHDVARNFDKDLAAFDLRSRRVFQLASLWSTDASLSH